MNKSKVKNPVRKKIIPFGQGLKGRSSRTYQNKLRELKSFYESTFKHSQEVKQSKKYPKKTKYFCDKYHTLKEYLKVNLVKEIKDKR